MTRDVLLRLGRTGFDKVRKNIDCVDCVDCFYCIDCVNCSNCENCVTCENCVDCKDCVDCYVANTWENSRYVINDEGFTKEEYESFMSR